MTTETGNPTELCLRLRNRIDKPHIFLYFGSHGWFHAASTSLSEDAWLYCCKVNHGFYRTPGEAARAWHNYKSD